MPTGNATADSITKSADQRGEASIKDVLGGGFAPDIEITPTLDSGSFVKQSKDILASGYNNPAIPQLFGKVEQSGRQAVDALNIIEEKYKQDELKRLPLDLLQKEVDDLQNRRTRVLPEILSDSKIVDFNAKLRISSMLQSMFDREIDKTLSKKTELEAAAASRAKLKADTMRSKASMMDKKLQNDQYLMTNAIDLFQSGAGSLQDILEAAVQMEESKAARAKAGGGSDGNPFMGIPGQDFTDEEVALFLKADKNFGRLDISDSVGKNYRATLNQRYYEWQQRGKPVRGATRASGPATRDGVVPTVMQILSGDAPGVNTFPQSQGDIISELLTRGAPGGARPVGEDSTE